MQNWQKVGLVVLLTIVLSLFVAYVLWGQISITLTLAAFSYLVGNLEALGWNPFLAKGLVATACIPFFLALGQIFRLPMLQRRGTPGIRAASWAVVAASVVGYFFAMYFASRDANFGPYQRYYVWAADGVRFASAPGVDPISGRELQPVTPHFFATYERWKKGIVPKRVSPSMLAEGALFDAVSHEPMFWYGRRSGGQIVLYDGVGFDEATGLPLDPVTPEIAALYDQQAGQRQAIQSQKASAMQQEVRRQQEAADRLDAERAASADSRRSASEKAAEVARAKEQVERYISQASAGPNGVAILIVNEDGTIDFETGNALATALGGSASVFRAALVKDGLFKSVRQGDTGRLTALGVQRFARTVVFGVVTTAARQAADRHPDLISAELRISATILREGGSLETLTSSGVGAGFSKDSAEAKAKEAATKAIIDRIRALFG